MSGGLRIRVMTRGDLEHALGWARAEGWNPGLEDAPAFLFADPGGFLIAEREGERVASLSIARFGDETAFLGLYIAAPEHRGRGLGHALWRAGMERLAPAVTGLDGVPAQQANYARSGFVYAHRTLRHAGRLALPPSGLTRAVGAADLPGLLAFDRAVTGYGRAEFLRAWLLGAESRHARVLMRDGAPAALGVLRACVEGWKLGPVLAEGRAEAEALLGDLAAISGEAPVSLDVPEPNAQAMAMAEALGLSPVFETARMWRGPAPAQDLARCFGVGTLELG